MHAEALEGSSISVGSGPDQGTFFCMSIEPWKDNLMFSTGEHEWKDDKDVRACSLCNGTFSMTNRKHHCRKCGECVCDSCSPKYLSLPGYSVQQRLCKPCFSECSAMNKFCNSQSHDLTHNLEFAAAAVRFDVFARGSPPYPSLVWLSASFMLVMFCTADGKLQSLPLHRLVEVVEGQVSAEFEGRLNTTSCGCISGRDAALEAKAACCFSLRFADPPQTLDLMASTSKEAGEWVARWRQAEVAVPFAKHHFGSGRLPVGRNSHADVAGGFDYLNDPE
jgi:hypothetical protein